MAFAGIDVDLIATAVVLGTVLAAPIMFVSAKMATITLESTDTAGFLDTVQDAGLGTGYMSLICVVVLGAALSVHLFSSKLAVPLPLAHSVLGLCLINFVLVIASQTCSIETNVSANIESIFGVLTGMRAWPLVSASASSGGACLPSKSGLLSWH